MKLHVSPEELGKILAGVEHDKPQEPMPPRRPQWLTGLGVLGAIVVGALVIFFLWQAVDPDEATLDRMQALLEKEALDAPGTAKWLKRRVVAHDGNWWAGYFEVDSQNSYGALIRNRICVAAEIRGGQIRSGSDSYARNCDPSEAYFRTWLDSRGWGKDSGAETSQRPARRGRTSRTEGEK